MTKRNKTMTRTKAPKPRPAQPLPTHQTDLSRVASVVQDALQSMRPPPMTETDKALSSAYGKLRWPPQHRFTPEETAALLLLLDLHARGEVKIPTQAKASSR